MEPIPAILLFAFLAYMIYRRFSESASTPKLAPQDESFAKAAVQEGLAAIGYSVDRTVDSQTEAMNAGLAIANERDMGAAVAVSIVALGLASNYISNKSMTEQRTALLMHQINELTADTFSLTPEVLWDHRGRVLSQNLNADFLFQKSISNAFGIASECRQSDFLARIVLAVAKDNRTPVEMEFS